jgi:hypothetical protein
MRYFSRKAKKVFAKAAKYLFRFSASFAFNLTFFACKLSHNSNEFFHAKQKRCSQSAPSL